MATVSHWTTSWEGRHLQPSAEHHWWMVPIDRHDVVAVTAHPIIFGPYLPPPPVELLVKDARSHIDDKGGRVFFFTVRNTGPNAVGAYWVNFSWVKA